MCLDDVVDLVKLASLIACNCFGDVYFFIVMFPLFNGNVFRNRSVDSRIAVAFGLQKGHVVEVWLSIRIWLGFDTIALNGDTNNILTEKKLVLQEVLVIICVAIPAGC